MLTFKKVTYTTLIMVLILLATSYFYNIPILAFILVTFLYGLLLFYGSYFIESNFYTKAICNGNKEINQVAISFDDGPSNSKTHHILDILKNNNIEAAFFCIGKNIKNEPDSVKRMVNENHIVGNHSESHHFFFDLFPEKKVIKEIDSTNKLIQSITGFKPKYFRPPYGVTTPIISSAVKKTGMTTIGWSLRSFDTITNDENKLIKKISNQIKAGDIILFHDTAEVTAHSLQRIIDLIKQKGMEIVRLDKLINLPGYA